LSVPIIWLRTLSASSIINMLLDMQANLALLRNYIRILKCSATN
jgi:hypothetical protein